MKTHLRFVVVYPATKYAIRNTQYAPRPPLFPLHFIYFDVDNTLLDHTYAEREALADTQRAFPDLLDRLSIEALQTEYHRINAPLWQQYAAGTIDKATVKHTRFKRLLEALNVDSTPADHVNAYYLERYAAHWRFIPGAREVYEAIANRYSVGLLTNGFVDIQSEKMEQFPVLTEHADAVVISETTGKLKPHPDVFSYAAAEARVSPQDILYVGDSYTSDVEGGQNAGWRVAWYAPNGTDGRSTDDRGFVFQEWDALHDRLLGGS